MKRGPWSPEEDEALRSYVQRHGSGGNWISMPKKAGELPDRSYRVLCIAPCMLVISTDWCVRAPPAGRPQGSRGAARVAGCAGSTTSARTSATAASPTRRTPSSSPSTPSLVASESRSSVLSPMTNPQASTEWRFSIVSLPCHIFDQRARRWSLIASQLEGRTDNDVKNYWNTKLKRRLLAAAATAGIVSTRSPPSVPRLPAAPASAPPAAATVTTHASSLFPLLAIPTVKTEMYTCDDFLAPAAFRDDPFAAADGSTSASAASSASNWSADNGAAGGGEGSFLLDFCAGSGLGAADDHLQLPGGYYYPLDPSLSLV